MQGSGRSLHYTMSIATQNRQHASLDMNQPNVNSNVCVELWLCSSLSWPAICQQCHCSGHSDVRVRLYLELRGFVLGQCAFGDWILFRTFCWLSTACLITAAWTRLLTLRTLTSTDTNSIGLPMDYYGVLVKRLANFERVDVFKKCNRALNASKCLDSKCVTCLCPINASI
jgi:hypothetical protein